MSEVVVSVDPAEKAGGSVFVDGVLHSYIAFDGSSFWTTYDAIEHMLAGVPLDATYLGLIEEGFVSMRSGNGSLTLGRRRGIVQAAMEAHGLTRITLITPSTWQPKILGWQEKGQTKVASQAYVLKEHNISPGPDVADSICLFHYYQRFGLTQAQKGVRVYNDGKLTRNKPPRIARKTPTDLSTNTGLSLSIGAGPGQPKRAKRASRKKRESNDGPGSNI